MDLGAGANAAFADAAALAKLLSSMPQESWASTALPAFERGMQRRGGEVIRASRFLTSIINARGWGVCTARAWLLRIVAIVRHFVVRVGDRTMATRRTL